MTFSVDGFARTLVEARRTGRLVPTAGATPDGTADAYAVQEAVAEAIGTEPAWKIGAPNPKAEPLAARILSGGLHETPYTVPAGAFSRTIIEVELAVRFARDVERDDIAGIKAAIGSLHALIEIVTMRFDTWPLPSPLLGIADALSNGALVVDPRAVPYSGQDLSAAHARLVVDGKTLFDAEGRNTAGDVERVLVWFAERLRPQGGIKAGTLVTLGSLCPPTPVDPGAHMVGEVVGIGRAELNPA